MKIITRGTPLRQKSYQATCRKCGCVFQFQREEAKYVSDQRDGDALVIKCPEHGCEEPAWVKP